MRYEQCKCGESIRYGSSFTYHGCEGCDKCGTTFSDHPGGHRPLQPHQWKDTYDRYTGEKDGRECQCGVYKRTEESSDGN